MHRKWLRAKRNELLVDLLKNFCSIHQTLCRQFLIYRQENTINFEVLSDLLGHEMNQGRLWRLKDTAHLLLRQDDDTPLCGVFIDWAIGYIFHECMKLKEDAYQIQKYVPWFKQVQNDTRFEAKDRSIGQRLFGLASQTSESIRREVNRIEYIMDECRLIFIHFLPEHRKNPLLARFIYDEEDIVRDVFQEQYAALLEAVYGDTPDDLYLLAAQSLREGGWLYRAQSAVDRGLELNPQREAIEHEKKIIANLLEKE
jgi:hypothetical protein